MSALAGLGLFLVISSALSFPDKGFGNVRPEYLDMLLETKQYDLFAKIMNIPVKLVFPNEKLTRETAMHNKDLEFGDIVPAHGDLKEESRQGMRFDRYPNDKWPNKRIPYYIANHYTQSELDTIHDAIRTWNNRVSCLKLTPYNNENDYVYVMNSNGCWAKIGRHGGQQGLSLQRNSCVWKGTILHEFEHAAGFAHEHNRLDRDDFVQVLWDNISNDWKREYEKTNDRVFGLQHGYDYYSIMHYPLKTFDTNKDAFRIKRSNVDTNRMGYNQDLSQTDINKIHSLYC